MSKNIGEIVEGKAKCRRHRKILKKESRQKPVLEIFRGLILTTVEKQTDISLGENEQFKKWIPDD